MADQNLTVIPCALCNEAAADPKCGVVATVLGLGNVMLYLCPADYERVRNGDLPIQTQAREEEKKHRAFEQMLQEAKTLATRIYGEQWSSGEVWPAREALWVQHRQEEDLYNQARTHYREANNADPDTQLTRFRVVRFAALCLMSAIGIEAIQAGEAVSGTLFRVTAAFTKGGFAIPGKEITRENVASALLVILHYREEKHQENEEEELALLSAEGQ